MSNSLHHSCRLVARHAASLSTIKPTEPTAHVSIPLGIFIGLLASFVQSLGLTIQRKSHVLNQKLPEHKQRVEHRRPLWLLGFTIFISSNILGSLVQIASLPVVILAPLGAVSLLWNAFFARFLLGDVFSPWMILGTILIAGGAVLIAVFGIVPEQARSIEDLLELFSRPAFVAYFSVLGATVVVCLVITHIADFSLSRRVAKCAEEDPTLSLTPSSVTIDLPSNPSALTTGVTETISEAISTERTPLLDRKSGKVSPPLSLYKDAQSQELHSINRARLFLAISYSSFSGIISGMCLLFAKSGVELLLLTLRGQNQFWRWQTWVLLLGLGVFALLQLWYLHKALILADPTLVCPSAFCFYNLSSIVNGLVYFDQFSLIPPLHLGLVTLGMFVLLGGVWVVSIHSGGGGVDVGMWNEEDDLTEEGVLVSPADSEDMLLNRQQTPEADEVTMDVTVASRKADKGRISAIPMERETVSESNIPTLSTSPNGAPAGSLIDDTSRRSRASGTFYPTTSGPSRHNTVFEGRALSPPYWPSQRRRPTLDRRTPSAGHIHTRTASHPYPSQAPVSPPLSTVSTFGTGFQIGLSPVSPGFTILPLERRRKLSALGGKPVLADVVQDVGQQERRRERERRRTVSEGDIGRLNSMLGNGANRSSEDRRDDTAAGDVTTATSIQPYSGKSRWRWLRKIIRGEE